MKKRWQKRSSKMKDEGREVQYRWMKEKKKNSTNSGKTTEKLTESKQQEVMTHGTTRH